MTKAITDAYQGERRKSTFNDEILMAALNDDDSKRVSELIDNCKIVRFDCGHGIHIEKANTVETAI